MNRLIILILAILTIGSLSGAGQQIVFSADGIFVKKIGLPPILLTSSTNMEAALSKSYSHVALVDKALSNYFELFIMKASREGYLTEEFDYTAILWSAYQRQFKVSFSGKIPDHSYMTIIHWVDDNQLLVELYGNDARSGKSIPRTKLLLNVKSREVSLP